MSRPELKMEWRNVFSRRSLQDPAVIVAILVNLIPLGGVIFQQWDLFILLMLYWLETAVVVFWNILRMAVLILKAAAESRFEEISPFKVKGMTLFILLGYFFFFVPLFIFLPLGFFMFIHFMFIRGLGGEAWMNIGSIGDLWERLVLESRIWGPLCGLFMSHGFAFFSHSLGLFLPIKPSGASVNTGPGPSASSQMRVGSFFTTLVEPYLRVALLQVVLIGGAFLGLVFGWLLKWVFVGVLGIAFEPRVIFIALLVILKIVMELTLNQLKTTLASDKP